MHFEASGYESVDFILNVGPVFVVICFLPLTIFSIWFFMKILCCKKVKGCLSKQLRKTIFNRIISFVDSVMLLTATSAFINLSFNQQGYEEDFKTIDKSYIFAIIFLVCTVIYLLLLSIALWRNFDKLNQPSIRAKISSAYSDFSIKLSGKPLITLIAL